MLRYELRPLSADAHRAIQQVLDEQLEQQRWCVIVVLQDLVTEIAIAIN